MNPNQTDPTNPAPGSPQYPQPVQAPEASVQPAPLPIPPSETAGSAQSTVPAASFDAPQPALTPAPLTTSESDRKKIRIIGTIAIILGSINVFAQLLPVGFGGGGVLGAREIFQITAGLVLALVGFGLLKYRKVAYTAFNIIAILSVLGGLFTVVPGAVAMLSVMSWIFATSLVNGAVFLLVSLVTIGIPVFYLVGLIVLHPKRIRALFH